MRNSSSTPYGGIAWVSSRANVKAVQTMLGHASAVLTLDTYSDLFPDDLDAVRFRPVRG